MRGFVFGFFLGAVLCAVAIGIFAIPQWNDLVESQNRSITTIGQLRTERAKAVSIVEGIDGTARSSREIIAGLRKLIQVYFPDD